MQKGKVYQKQVPYFGDMVHVTQIISSEYWKVKHVISYLQNMIFLPYGLKPMSGMIMFIWTL